LQDPAEKISFSRIVFLNSFVVLLVGLLAVMLVPGWILHGDFGYSSCVELLLPAELAVMVGFLVVLSAGAIDMGIWPVMCLSGILAICGAGFEFAFFPAVLVSLAAGATVGTGGAVIASLLPVGRRVSVVVATTAVGIGIMIVCRFLPSDYANISVSRFALQLEAIHDFMYGDLPANETFSISPLVMTRMLSVFVLWSLVQIVFLKIEMATGWLKKLPWGPLVLSGALSGISGFYVALERSDLPVPERIIDDWQVPAAVVLSGVLITKGKNGLVISIVLLPVCAVLVSLWRMQVWPGLVFGYSPSMVMLPVFLMVSQFSFAGALQRGGISRLSRLISTSLCFGGLVVMAAPSFFGRFGDPAAFVAGAVTGMSGVLAFLVTRILERRHQSLIRPIL